MTEARRMETWPANWDGEDSPGYKAATLDRVEHFLLIAAQQYWRQHRRELAVPDIEPGPEGSIDLHWDAAGADLLISVPADPDKMATYSVENNLGETSIGSFDTSKPPAWLLMWLK